jgi:hypothetical protein
MGSWSRIIDSGPCEYFLPSLCGNGSSQHQSANSTLAVYNCVHNIASVIGWSVKLILHILNTPTNSINRQRLSLADMVPWTMVKVHC